MQSVLDPAGVEAQRIADLAIILFAGGGAILLLVVLAIGLALVGPAFVRRALASDALITGAGIVLPAVLLSLLLTYGTWVTRGTVAQSGTPADLTIDVVGEQWWWRVAYTAPGGQRITHANEVRLPIGREIEIVVTSPDVIHSFWVPALAGKVDMIPGRTNRLRLSVERAGIYRGQCAEYCGGPHGLMAFDVMAMPGEDFERWLASGATIEPAVRQGRDLFVSSGCGACHAVRGTEAAGEVGPDLTRVGARRTIAAGTLPMSRENLSRFIANAQRIKPGNLMPPFEVLSQMELDAITDYLMSLR